MKTYIPFSGFYGAIHSDELFRVDDSITIDVKKFYTLYADEYTELINRELDIKLEFLRVESPTEYNFQTDKILCDISAQDAEELRCEYWYNLKIFARDNFTSRDEFVSFINPNFEEWGNIENWSTWQLWALLSCSLLTDLNDIYIDNANEFIDACIIED